jgi:site-specific DNA-adenine methylase
MNNFNQKSQRAVFEIADSVVYCDPLYAPLTTPENITA